MNTAIEADDTHPELRARARQSMTLWHRLIGRIVKDGIAAGTLAPETDSYDLASFLTAALEGGLMLSRLYDDPAHMDRVIEHLTEHTETLRAQPKECQR
jgi:TetR/AcrR family transcriptional repressor of nem operon